MMIGEHHWWHQLKSKNETQHLSQVEIRKKCGMLLAFPRWDFESTNNSLTIWDAWAALESGCWFWPIIPSGKLPFITASSSDDVANIFQHQQLRKHWIMTIMTVIWVGLKWREYHQRTLYIQDSQMGLE